MRAVLIYPPVDCSRFDCSRDCGCAPHLGLLSLVTAVRARHPDWDVTILDGHLTDESSILRALDARRPHLIGLSVDVTNYPSAVRMLAEMKALGASILLGGAHATFLAEAILTRRQEVDAVVLGDGEEALTGYLEALAGLRALEGVPNLLYRSNGRLRRTRARLLDLRELPGPAYDIADWNAHFARQAQVFGPGVRIGQIYSQKGCLNKPLCSFCGRFPDPCRKRDPDRVAAEAIELATRHQLTEIWDRTDSLVQDPAFFLRLVDRLRVRGAEAPASREAVFKVYGRADQLADDAVLEGLRQMRVRMVFIGYESGDDRVLQLMGKHVSAELYLRATEKVLKHGIDVDASLIVGLPGECTESLRNQIRFVQALVDRGVQKIRVNLPWLLPGSRLYQGLLKEHPELAGDDLPDMAWLQDRLFETGGYHLAEFGGSLAAFRAALEETTREACDLVLKRGGVVEGYAHEGGKSFVKGNEMDLARRGRHA
jgi:anaerobic magnesium-protoporphyrin IX monomethyl ester cyclase